jgi:NitT/TauT family transport system ATP-binding protein
MGDNIFSRKLQEEKEKNAVVVEPIVEEVVEPIVEQSIEETKPEETKPEEKKKLFSSLFGKKKVKEIKEVKEEKEIPLVPVIEEKLGVVSKLFENTFHDTKVIHRKSEVQRYEKVNVIDLVNIHQDYNVILQTPPGKEVAGNNNMFIKPSAPKAVHGKNVVFEDFNLSIKDISGRGQFTTILGKSGCGKSTILKYICGLQKPTSGEIYLHGKKLQESDRIPMVFQQYSSFPWMSVLRNIALPLLLKGVSQKEAYEKAMEMIKVVGLEGQESKFAKMPNLSGGQLQRVAIARNLVADPTILLMDEPFGALDIITRRSMQVFLRKVFQDNNGLDPTVVLVTHDIREAIFLSSDIYILDANPASVRCHIEVDLPNVREINLKRDPKFLEYVNYIEDMMEKIENETK